MKNSELINHYFEGTLTDAQEELFEDFLKNDSDFLNEFNFQKQLQAALKKEERRKTKEFLRSIDVKRTTEASNIKSRSLWLAAASVLIVIGVSLWFVFFYSSEFDADSLYAQYYAPYENVVHPLERGDNPLDVRSEAFLAYEKGDYKEALPLFNQLAEQFPDNNNYKLYQAITLMELEEFPEAVSLFQYYIKKEGELSDRARWYLALSYLKLKNYDKASMQLVTLMESGGYKFEKAQELKEKLP